MIDLNVLLDVVQRREPFYTASAATLSQFLRARTLDCSDFEDAVVASAAEASGCEIIITRNIGDFADAPIPAVTPEEFLVRE
jgi:PIN domain-containing protein